MPRNYIRKKPDFKPVTAEQITEALKHIEEGKSQRAAASAVGISESSLRKRLKLNTVCSSLGRRKAVSSATEETEIVEHCNNDLRQSSEVYSEDNSSLFLHYEDLEVAKSEPDDGESSTKLEPDDDSEKFGEESNGLKRQAWETNSDYETAKRTKLSDSDEADLNFFKSLLPDIRKMDGKQRNQLKIAILNAIDNILYNES